MSDRAKELIDSLWAYSKSEQITEEQLISKTLSLAASYVKSYNAQRGIIVLDKADMIALATEVSDLKQ
jgi:hypothetical protein